MPDDRGRRGLAHTLLTPANRYASRLPGLKNGLLYKLVTPRLAPARFGQALVALDPSGTLDVPTRAGHEHFLYVLRGTASLDGTRLHAGAYAYRPAAERLRLACAPADGPAEVLWLQRPYEAFPGTPGPPQAVTGHRDEIPSEATAVSGLTRQELLNPTDPAFDFTMSLLRFDPGTDLGKIEIHDEEHGLYMTAGAGAYELDGTVYEVQRDDFVYMAPYCPQGFTNTGAEPAEYLLYKDVFRDGFSHG